MESVVASTAAQVRIMLLDRHASSMVNKQAKQRVVLLGALGRHGLLLDIDLDIGDGVHAGDEPDDAYQKDEDRRERIEMEPQAQSVDILPAREHGSRGDDRKDEGRRDGDGV
ncbi:MAG: hypothetical protein ACLU0V_01260, partial [Eggerthella lenta]